MMQHRWPVVGLGTLWLVLIAGPGLAVGGELLPPDRPVEQVVDHYVNERLAGAGVAAAPVADDANLLRRTLLDLVGRIPTAAETQAYLADSSPDKRVRLVDRWLNSPAYVSHQANEFDRMLTPDSKGGMREYLLQAFQEQRPWDQMFREMMLGRDDDPEQKGALQFVRTRAADLDKLTNETSVLFFGVNISCAQCHDHPLAPEWTQHHFYGMKSFFARTFENGGFVGEREYGLVTFESVDGEKHDADLMFFTGTTIDEPKNEEPTDEQKKAEKQRLEEWKKNKQAPEPPSFSRRAQLVEVALRQGENNYFARAIVNRVWYRLFGFGLVNPIDQMHPDNPASHPELLEWLARDLVAHQYDLSRLTRGLLLSDAYARSSVWSESQRPDPSLFAVANVRPLSAHQYATTLRLASTNPDWFGSDVSAEEVDKRLQAAENAARGFAGQIEQPNEDFQVSTLEALYFSNNDRFRREFLRTGGDSLIGKLMATEDVAERVTTAYGTVFNRAPTDEERAAVEAYFAERTDEREAACRQVVWALLTSSECRFNY